MHSSFVGEIGKLRCVLLNARSLVNKIDDIRCYVFETDPDIVMVTESWGRDAIDDVSLNLPGYFLKRRDRNSRLGKGCLIYVKDHIVVTFDDELTYNNNVESVCCKIHVGVETIFICVCYRSPTCHVDEEKALHDIIRTVCDNKPGEKLIVGDFNYSSINWETLQSDFGALDFVELTQDCYLSQMVEKPTRGENILDLISTTNESLVQNMEICEPLGTSDPNMVTFGYSCTFTGCQLGD